MKIRFPIALIVLLIAIPISGMAILFQNSSVISGTVYDDETKAPLPSATVFLATSKRGTSTDQNGRFSLLIGDSSLSDSLVIRYLGYQSSTIFLNNIEIGQPLEVFLKPTEISFENVFVYGESVPIQDRTQMSYVRLPMAMIKSLPSFMGQTDVFKSIQALPGVSPGIEGSTGFYVRGGSIDHSLFTLDNAPIFFPFHSGGFVSLFPAGMLQNVDFYSGGFPAKYGDRLGSVTDITSLTTRNEELSGSATLGIISAEGVLGGRINEKIHFTATVRKSVLTQSVNMFKWSSEDHLIPNNPFFDAFFSINMDIDKFTSIKFSHFLGSDRFETSSSISQVRPGSRFENSRAFTKTVRNNVHSVNIFRQKNRLFSQFTLYYSGFRGSSSESTRYVSQTNESNRLAQKSELKTGNEISEFGVKLDNTLSVFTWLKTNVGVETKSMSLRPFIKQSLDRTQIETISLSNETIDKSSFLEYSGYGEIVVSPFSFLELVSGVRVSGFSHLSDEQLYLQPRFGGRLKLGKNLALKASHATMIQPFHFLTSAGFGVNSDLWIASSDELKPSESVTSAVGVVFGNDNWEFSAEAYQRSIEQVIDYGIGTTFLNPSQNISDMSVVGEGESEGYEFLIMKKTGKVSGWVSYTYSRSFRSFEEISDGQRYPFTYDRPHLFSMNGTWNIFKRISLSSVFSYQSGHNVTFPKGRVNGLVNNPMAIGPFNYGFVIENRNNFRIPAYHRLDISVSYSLPTKIKTEVQLGIYNAYNRANPVNARIDFFPGANDQSFRVFASYEYLFPAIPFLSVTSKF